MIKTPILIISFLALLISGCTKIFYIGEAGTGLPIYAVPNNSASIVYTIPEKEIVLNQQKNKQYSYVIYRSYKGYVYKPAFIRNRKYNSATDGNLYGYSSTRKKKQSVNNTPTTSPRSSSTKAHKSGGGPVQVKGYTRKDGTYVKPHTRNAPKRRG